MRPMRKIRKGKDITLRWEILTGGEPLPLEGRDLTLLLKETYRTTELPFTIEGNMLTAVWRGTEHQYLGAVRLSLWENRGKDGQTVVDKCDAFSLVRCTCEETPSDDTSLKTATVDLGSSGFDASPGGGCTCDSLTPEEVEGMWEEIINKDNQKPT